MNHQNKKNENKATFLFKPLWKRCSLPLSSGLPKGIDVWLITPHIGKMSLLSSVEKQTLESIKNPHRRLVFLSVRSAIRQIVSAYLELDPKIICLAKESNGRPFLVNTDSLHVSITHTHSTALLAFSTTAVGIDIEYRDRPLNALIFSKRFFSNEDHIFIKTLPTSQQSSTFLQMWTAKEATLKLLNHGLANKLSKLITLYQNSKVVAIQHDAEITSIFEFYPVDNYLAFLASNHSSYSICWKHFIY